MGVPIPECRGGRARPIYIELRQHMRQLLIGGSFFYPAETARIEDYVRNAAWRLASTDTEFPGWKIATRKLFENGQTGIRIWRTK